MKKMFYIVLFILLTACSKKDNHSYSFYYWKTKLSLNKIESDALNKATAPVLYTRFFDIDKIEGKFQPVGVIFKDKTFVTEKTIVPVVYITTRSFLNIQKEEIPFLAKNVTELINKKSSEFGLKLASEIQIDCDWTAGMKNDYFEFLKELQKISGKEVTSTLRLHQVKDKELSGIPPVKKVYLMCYSTSSPLENSDKNSILDNKLMKNYLAKLEDYPIKNMDVALPIYSWAIVTNHLGKHKLINGISSKDLDNPKFKKISKNKVQVNEDGFYFGFFLNKGFKIKVEEISEDQLDNAVNSLNKKIKNYNIIYYQLDRKFANNQNLRR